MKTEILNDSKRGKPLQWRSRLCTCLGLALFAGFGTTGQVARAQLPDVSANYSIQVVAPPQNTPIVVFLLINDSGMIPMEYLNSDFQLQAAILQNGVWQSIDVPNSVQTGTSAPNSSGRLALIYCGASGIWHNTIYHRGTYTDLPDFYGPPGQPAYSFSIMLINDSGMMTGVATDANGVPHGLMLNQSLSLFRVFDPPGSVNTLPFGINNAGDIVGMYTLPDGTGQGFWSNQGITFTDVDVPGGTGAVPIMINNNGEICGSYVDLATGVIQSFLLQHGVYSAIKLPNTSWSAVNCITDTGDLAGTYADPAGNQYGFIARRIAGR